MDPLDAHILSQIVSGEIDRVEFRKDAEAADLLIVDIDIAGTTWTLNEDFSGWPGVVTRLEALEGFPADWRAQASGLSGDERWEAWGGEAG